MIVNFSGICNTLLFSTIEYNRIEFKLQAFQSKGFLAFNRIPGYTSFSKINISKSENIFLISSISYRQKSYG
jgi:hypothetical protein